MKKFVCSLVVIFSVSAGCNNSIPENTSINTDSFDYRYSKNRFKMEGYSDKDSETAARAIMKFNQAQKNRK